MLAGSATPLEFPAGARAIMCPICGEARPLPLRWPASVPGHLVGADAGGHEATIAEQSSSRAAVRCSGCRAMLSSPRALDRCPLCDRATPTDELDDPVTLASGYLPFLLEGNAAHEAVSAELRRLSLTAGPEPLTPVYLPWVLVSSQVSADYEGEVGFEVEEVRNGKRYVRVEWSQAIGKVERPWDDRGGCMCVGLPRELGERLAPWDFAFTEPLAELDALDAAVEHIRCDVARSFEWAVPNFQEELRAAAFASLDAAHRKLHAIHPIRHDERVRLILVPAWLGRTSQGVRLVVNARTGEVVVAGHAGAEPEESELELEPDTGRDLRLVVTIVAVVGIAALVFWLMLK